MATKSKKSKPIKTEATKQDIIDYSLQIDKLRQTEPHKSTNKYIDSLIKDTIEKTKKESYSSGFWNGLVLGVIVAFIVWTILMFR